MFQISNLVFFPPSKKTHQNLLLLPPSTVVFQKKHNVNWATAFPILGAFLRKAAVIASLVKSFNLVPDQWMLFNPVSKMNGFYRVSHNHLKQP